MTKGYLSEVPILFQKACNTLVTPMELRLCMDGGDHLPDLCTSQVFGRGLNAHRVGGVRSSARVSFTGEDEGFERRKSATSRLGTSPRPSIVEERGDSTVLRYLYV
ncbi:hypothetical protein EVAR_11322_1 [Eumeta japonica]|uniref:Uncharacterized protein n=1 Tax=Eumeta variegata TaxID=151549 RepID=A0A4C1U0S3_EUMVA|nr:hypothetical protein EVAR_11322_1 [Eumeta japonica]